MRGMIRKCVACGEYTLKRDACPYCGGTLRTPHPAKFSPEDKYSRFRLALKLREKAAS
ncbi:MAG: RNA-protein complex protein Nop10 [Candidatus Verstraetearchaeota archaeon]|nr:RNA-protein complex protein Nop10 [Candidatus Verstraetearchaeota archaeon]